MNKTIIEELRDVRIEQGITTEKLAALVGVHQPNIARIESGKHSPKLATVEKVANALGFEIVLKKKDEKPRG